ncbi:MAG TPA: hypothetical protein VEF53_08325 [Patescibacteria group bacterium]|jgi:hypothetical protein|nr:hypothetical protein [Patescibacteria group bacterium]
MKVEKASFGYLVILMVEEQNDRAVMEEIKKLKENGKVAVLISGNENALVGISKVIKNTIQRE